MRLGLLCLEEHTFDPGWLVAVGACRFGDTLRRHTGYFDRRRRIGRPDACPNEAVCFFFRTVRLHSLRDPDDLSSSVRLGRFGFYF